MKNIHVLPTHKLSKFYKCRFKGALIVNPMTDVEACFEEGFDPQCVHITSKEELKEGDWCILLENHYVNGWVGKYDAKKAEGCGSANTAFFLKIILTTDQDLIKDGVQAIPDQFLEWFVKNSACEFVEVNKDYDWNSGKYYNKIKITNWQQEKSYSKEEVLKLLVLSSRNFYAQPLDVAKWFEQFKK